MKPRKTTENVIKNHIKIVDNIISGRIDSLIEIYSYYHDKLCQEALAYLKKETKTRKYNTFLKKINISSNLIKLDEKVRERCLETNVFYRDAIPSNYIHTFLGLNKYQSAKLLKEGNIEPLYYKRIPFLYKSISIAHYDIFEVMKLHIKLLKDTNIQLVKLKEKIKPFKIDRNKMIVFREVPLNGLCSVIISKKVSSINEKQIISAVRELQEKTENYDVLKKTFSLFMINDVPLFVTKDKFFDLKKGDRFNYNKEQRMTYEQLESIVRCKEDYFKSSIINNVKINFLSYYPAMKNKKRKITFILGETNSGKTHKAMSFLKEAKKGVYLSPLRILSHEKYDELEKCGLKSSLINGEINIKKEGATHLCATIECLDPNEMYDVGIIDEIQMIGDEERGDAWLKAMLALNAENVYILGQEQFKEKEDIFNFLNKNDIPFSVEYTKRLSKLEKLEKGININEIKKGDAIIAFDKNTLFLIATQVQQKYGKNSVSLLFGDLSYQRKKEELFKFQSGNSDFLIATDAIAMGLNLPIKRILFYKTYKYICGDNLPINQDLFKQIIGRAGRYKEDGFYGIFESKEINNCLHNKDKDFLKSKNKALFNRFYAELNKKTECNQNSLLKREYYFDEFIMRSIYNQFLEDGVALKNNYIAFLRLYQSSNPFVFEKDIDFSPIFSEVIKKVGMNGLISILPLCKGVSLLKYDTIKEWTENIIFNKEWFIAKKIAKILNLQKLLDSIENYEHGIEKDYSYNWDSYAKDLSYEEHYEEDYY